MYYIRERVESNPNFLALEQMFWPADTFLISNVAREAKKELPTPALGSRYRAEGFAR